MRLGMSASERVNNIGSYFRFITPVLVSISLFVMGQVWMQVNDLNAKLYAHVTNDDLHTPKAEIVSLRTDILEMRREVITVIRDLRTPLRSDAK